MSAPDVSVVVLSWNTADLLEVCLDHLWRAEPGTQVEVIVVDNASEDDSAERVRRNHPRARLIVNERNLGYAAGNNVGIAAARGRHVFLLNSDTEVLPDAIGRLAAALDADPWLGAAAARLENLDGSTQRACMRFPTLPVLLAFDTCWRRLPPFARVLERYFYADFDHEHDQDVEQPPAAALMLPRRVIAEVGAFDPDLFLFFNDVDLCRRLARAGLRRRYVAGARVRHHGGASTRRYRQFALEWHKNRARYYLRSHGALGFRLAQGMTAWRALEEWWKTARRMTDPAERAAATRAIADVVREVWSDTGGGDPRVAASAVDPPRRG